METDWSEATIHVKGIKVVEVSAREVDVELVKVATSGPLVRIELISYYDGEPAEIPEGGAEVEMPLSEWDKIVAEVNRQLGRD